MLNDLNPSAPLNGLRRALAWLALAGGGMATLGMAWRTVLLTVAVALGGCAALPHAVERPASYAQADVSDTALAKIACRPPLLRPWPGTATPGLSGPTPSSSPRAMPAIPSTSS